MPDVNENKLNPFVAEIVDAVSAETASINNLGNLSEEHEALLWNLWEKTQDYAAGGEITPEEELSLVTLLNALGFGKLDKGAA